MAILFGLLVACAAIPLAIRRPALGVVFGILEWIVAGLIFYAATPSLAGPLFGGLGFAVLVALVINFIVDLAASEHENGNGSFVITLAPAMLCMLLFMVVSFVGAGCMRSSEYARILGEPEQRVWTQDVQPKDPRHVRLVPQELACWLADKQLGEAGAIGSQFQVAKDLMELQLVNGELWYVAPLEFRGFATWNSVGATPGYVMVHGEDPMRSAVLKTNQKLVYTPDAFFNKNLERHLWSSGYATSILTDYTLEVDDEGRAWWVVTVAEPTIAFWAPKVTGALVVDPTTGAFTFYAHDKVPHWVDRVVPQDFVVDYISWWGKYQQGWVNSWWAELGCVEPETPMIVYGADGEPYWATCTTSTNQNDEALVGVVYINSRTGKAMQYKASGSTEAGALTAVNNKVSYRKLHGASPILYNIEGTMSTVIPLLGESHTFQGVAIVRLDNLQVAIGDNAQAAYREYQKLLAHSGAQIAPDAARTHERLEGKVLRIAAEHRGGDTTYYLYLEGQTRLFTGGSELSPKLPLTQPGDTVMIGFIASPEDVVPLLSFDNAAIAIKASPAQTNVRERATERHEGAESDKSARDAQEELKNLSPEELQKLLDAARREREKK